MSSRLTNLWLKLPRGARKIIVDFVETFVGLVFTLNFVVPGTLDEAKAQAILVWGALTAAAVSSLRRGAPTIIAWLRTTFPVAAIRTLVGVVTLALAMQFTAAPVSAVNNYCSVGWIVFYEFPDQQGRSAKYCWINHDSNMVNDFGGAKNLGPLWDTSYKRDFHVSTTKSGIQSIWFFDSQYDGTEVNACIYASPNYEKGTAFVHTTGRYNVPAAGHQLVPDVGSFRFVTFSSGSYC